jgi:arylsulfatase A-like enzyme
MDDARLESLSRKFPIIAEEFEPTAEELDVLTAWYDGAIRYLDDRIGGLLDFLSRHDELDDTYVIVTADHGELFGEHGLEKHFYSLYEPVLRVPLVIDPPVDAPFGSQTVSESVTLADLYPTILEFAGVTPPARSHADSFAETGRPPTDRYVYAEVGSKLADPIRRHHPSFGGSEFDGPLRSVRDEEYKLIRRPDGELELYNWREDRDERWNLVDEEPEIVEQLLWPIEHELQPMSDSSFQEHVTDPALKEHLEDLGYM